MRVAFVHKTKNSSFKNYHQTTVKRIFFRNRKIFNKKSVDLKFLHDKYVISINVNNDIKSFNVFYPKLHILKESQYKTLAHKSHRTKPVCRVL